MLYLAVLVYSSALLAANLLVAQFGPAVTPVNSFLLIGLDLALRDWMQMRLSPKAMAALIAATGVVTYWLNPSAGGIALASSVSFVVAALVDWAAFCRTSGSWLRRSVVSNLAGAGVDSLVFPLLAFGGLMPAIVLLQFAAKAAGGAAWASAFSRIK